MRIWTALALIPILGGCDLFSAETNIDNACVALSNQSIDGAPIDKLSRTFSYDDLNVFDGFISLNAEVSKLSIDIKGVSGVSDLTFLQTVHVTIATDDLPAVEVLSCENGACASETLESHVEVTAPPHLTDYALGGHVQVTVSIAGTLPRSEWRADLKVCLSGSARVAGAF